MKIKQSTGSCIFDICLHIFFVLVCIAMLYPFWNSFILSLMQPAEAGSMGVKFYAKNPTLSAYRYVLSSSIVLISYRNTVLRTLIVTVSGTIITFLAAYPLANKSLPFRKLITLYLLIPMFFTGGLIPNYLLINQLNIFDSFLALVLPCLVTIYNILIARNFVMSIPVSLEESALLDGASYMRIFWSIILPLSTPIIATIALWIAVATWNEWFQASIYTRKTELKVLQTYLRSITIEKSTDLEDTLGNEAILSRSIEAATVLVSIGPIVLVYPFFQKYFVKGVMVGSLKG